MTKREFNQTTAQENYLENMLALVWQEHIIKYDKNKEIFILGVNIEGSEYFKEMELKKFAGVCLNGEIKEFLNKYLKEIANEVINWKETKESKEYQEWIKKLKEKDV